MSTRRAARRPSATPLLAAAAAMALLVLPATAAAATPTPVDLGAIRLTLEPFAEGFESPVFATGDGSGTGRLYVVEQGGRILAVSPDGTVDPEPVADLTERVTAGGEQGLLGLALHPDVRENGRLFVDYTRAEDGATVVSELTLGTDGRADAATERVLLTIPQPEANHNGGMLAFDADGMLLIGMGDGGGGGDPDGNGQDPTSLLGKILRLDVDQPGADPEIRALGLRNPWRFSVDRATGDLWIGDVGQGDLEEIDLVPRDAGTVNLGWNVMEGDRCYEARSCDRDGLTLPVATLDHGDGACSIIGGYVYRGKAIPRLQGAYLFTDVCIGDGRLLDAAAAATGTPPAVVAWSDQPGIVSFGETDDGELLAVGYDGTIRRVAAADPS